MTNTPYLLNRRTLLASAAALLAVSGARAQGFPNKPITLICPFSAGGTADAQLRTLGAAASKQFGQAVIIDNKPGAAGTMGPGGLVGAAADGYLLSQATGVALLRQPFIQKTRYDPAKDFSYVIGVTRFEIGLVVRADAPWKTAEEFLLSAKNKPGSIAFGTAGFATAQHTAMLQLADKLGIDWTHVPFKGSGDVFNALAGGHVQAISETTGWAPFVDSGKFRVLALFSDARLKRWPDVPTFKELGHPVVESVAWGIVGPAGMDAPLVAQLHDGFRKAIDDPAFVKILGLVGQEPWAADSQAYRQYTMARIPIERELVNKYRLREQ
ncbi:MAG: tripartite tricarboxylate transporter receptor family protein [Rhizobacter sp.]|nr:tripartite tricarboxylate transporter receptor family protein [Rhizobacter sp.]